MDATDIALDTAVDSRMLEELVAEMQRYLDAVDLFRAELHEPSWRDEGIRTEVLR